jgi:hypothetical protein
MTLGDSTLPRLGSRVRILSPAPDFLRKVSDLERSLGLYFASPFHSVRSGKQQEEGRSGRATILGILRASNVPTPAASSDRQDCRTVHRCNGYPCFPRRQWRPGPASPDNSLASSAKAQTSSCNSGPAWRIGMTRQTSPEAAPCHARS